MLSAPRQSSAPERGAGVTTPLSVVRRLEAADDQRTTLPWDCTQDAELVGSVTAHQPVGCRTDWLHNPARDAREVHSGKLNYDTAAERGLKRAKCTVAGDEHRVRFAETVQVCELTSVREFHMDSALCLDTDDLESIFEQCGMRVPLSPSTVAAS